MEAEIKNLRAEKDSLINLNNELNKKNKDQEQNIEELNYKIQNKIGKN